MCDLMSVYYFMFHWNKEQASISHWRAIM